MSRIDVVEITKGTSGRGFSSTGTETGSVQTGSTSQQPAPRYNETGAGQGQVAFESTVSRLRGGNKLDRALLDRASEVLHDIEHTDAEAMSLAIESLRYVVCQLWISATAASIYHQSILAIVESVTLSAETITHGKAAALRGAFNDLSQEKLSEQYVEVVQSRFIDEGHNPLAPLSAFKDDADGNSD